MRQIKVNNIVKALLIVCVLLASCSGYERILKSKDYKLKYKKALEYYAGEDYIRAGALFDQIAPVIRGTEQADTVYFYQAMCYYYQRDLVMAGHYFRNFARTWGSSEFSEEAYYKSAYCYYMMSPRPALDQDNSVQAIQAFQLYLIKYPESEKAEECRKLILELKEKLVEKSYLSAKLYYDMEDYKASLVALNNSMIEFPESKFREEIMYMVLKSNFALAENSIISKKKERYQNTIDEYYSFISEFPESKFRKDADRMFYASSGKVNINESNNLEDGL